MSGVSKLTAAGLAKYEGIKAYDVPAEAKNLKLTYVSNVNAGTKEKPEHEIRVSSALLNQMYLTTADVELV